MDNAKDKVKTAAEIATEAAKPAGQKVVDKTKNGAMTVKDAVESTIRNRNGVKK